MSESYYFLEVSPSSSRVYSVAPGSGRSVPLGNTMLAATEIHALTLLFTKSLSFFHLMSDQLRQRVTELISVMLENLPFDRGEEVYWYPGAAMLAEFYSPSQADMKYVELATEATKESILETSVLELARFLQFDSVVTLRPWRVLRVEPAPLLSIQVQESTKYGFHDVSGKHHSWIPVPSAYVDGNPQMYPLACDVAKIDLEKCRSVAEVVRLFREY